MEVNMTGSEEEAPEKLECGRQQLESHVSMRWAAEGKSRVIVRWIRYGGETKVTWFQVIDYNRLLRSGGSIALCFVLEDCLPCLTFSSVPYHGCQFIVLVEGPIREWLATYLCFDAPVSARRCRG